MEKKYLNESGLSTLWGLIKNKSGSGDSGTSTGNGAITFKTIHIDNPELNVSSYTTLDIDCSSLKSELFYIYVDILKTDTDGNLISGYTILPFIRFGKTEAVDYLYKNLNDSNRTSGDVSEDDAVVITVTKSDVNTLRLRFSTPANFSTYYQNADLTVSLCDAVVGSSNNS